MSDRTEQIQFRIDAARRQMIVAIDQMNLPAAKAALANYRLANNELAIAEREEPSPPALPEVWPEAYTISGDLIVPGLWVLDCNWQVGMVTDKTPDANNGINDSIVHWFHLTTGYFDGSRMWSRHPATGRRITAPDEA